MFKILQGHKAAVYCAKFSKDGEHIMSGSQDRSIKLWNPHKQLLIKTYDNIHSQDVLDIAIEQDNSKFASVGNDKQVFLTDSITGNTLKRYYGHTERINTVCYNQGETVLISGSYDTTVRIWDLKSTSREPIQILSDAKDSITKVLATGDKIITSSVDGFMRIYDIRMGQSTFDSFDVAINNLDISGDEKYLIISGLDDCIRLFDITSGEVIKTYTGLHESRNYSLTVRYTKEFDGILSTSERGDIVYYDLVNKEKNQVFKGHSKVSCGLDLHPSKKNVFVSSGFDGNILLWDLDNKTSSN
jgi:mitogen-activated protein kinase organizer 1